MYLDVNEESRFLLLKESIHLSPKWSEVLHLEQLIGEDAHYISKQGL